MNPASEKVYCHVYSNSKIYVYNLHKNSKSFFDETFPVDSTAFSNISLGKKSKCNQRRSRSSQSL